MHAYLIEAFPTSARAAASEVAAHLASQSPQPPRAFTVAFVAGEAMRIPSRVYFETSAIRELWDALDGAALAAALCIGTRSYDGYLRERCLRRLFGHDHHWAVPYVLALAGEYVIEIVQLIVDIWPSLDRRAYGAFARDNPAFVALTRQRVLSYWDCYYRWTMPLDRYPGMQMLRVLEAAAAEAAA